MSLTRLRRKRNIAVVALAAAGLTVGTAAVLAASTPVPVKTSPRNELTPAAGDDWLAWSQSRQGRPKVFDVFAQQTGRSRLQGQSEGHPGVRGRDRRDDARLPAASRQAPIGPEAVRPHDPPPPAGPGRNQHLEVGVLRDGVGRLDPLRPRRGVQPGHADGPPPQPRDRRATGARRPAEQERPRHRRAGERELRRLAALQPSPALPDLPLRPRDRHGDGAARAAGKDPVRPLGERSTGSSSTRKATRAAGSRCSS